MSIRPLPRKLQEKAKLELNEVPKRLQDDVDHIVEWINKQPHLNARTDAQFIVAFLRGCKFSLQKTKEKLDMFFTVRIIAPYYFTDRNPFSPEVQRYYELNIFNILREEPNSLSPRRALIIVKNSDPNKISVRDAIKSVLMLIDLWLYNDDVPIINGQEAIIDLKDAPLSHVTQWTPSLLKTVAFLMQHAYPSRLKGLYFINVPSIAETVVNAITSFFSKKIRSRVHVYSRGDDIYKIIPRASFPNEYGGSAGTIEELSQKLLHELESHYQWFKEDSKYCTDESKRPAKPIISEEFFNVEGSFRKLEID